LHYVRFDAVYNGIGIDECVYLVIEVVIVLSSQFYFLLYGLVFAEDDGVGLS
jgi:hypothetical protein